MSEELVDLVKQKKELLQFLAEMGVPTNRLNEVVQRIEEHNGLERDLDKARKQQFANDGRTLGEILKCPGKFDVIAPYLRNFAEYIVEKTLTQFDIEKNCSVVDIVDLIAPMDPRDIYDR